MDSFTFGSLKSSASHRASLLKDFGSHRTIGPASNECRGKPRTF
jgi:hypothetical protein